MVFRIDPSLKPLYANLLELGIAEYLITKEFDYVCLENDIDVLWEAFEQEVVQKNDLGIAFPGYSGDAEEAFGPFLAKSFSLGKDFFIEKIGAILSGFVRWSNEHIDFSKVKKSLLTLGFSEIEVQDILLSIEMGMPKIGQFIGNKNESESLFWKLIHPAITSVSQSRFESGHYSDSVETAFKIINTRVKIEHKRKTSKELDGKDLMLQAFSPNNPSITIGDASTTSGRNEQEGYMHIFAGAWEAIRNPKAHEVAEISRDLAIHKLFLASLLMHVLDKARCP